MSALKQKNNNKYLRKTHCLVIYSNPKNYNNHNNNNNNNNKKIKFKNNNYHLQQKQLFRMKINNNFLRKKWKGL